MTWVEDVEYLPRAYRMFAETTKELNQMAKLLRLNRNRFYSSWRTGHSRPYYLLNHIQRNMAILRGAFNGNPIINPAVQIPDDDCSDADGSCRDELAPVVPISC